MQQDVNLIIENFKGNIIKECERNGLPISVVYYVFKSIFSDLEKDYQLYLEQAKQNQRMAEAAATIEEAQTEKNED